MATPLSAKQDKFVELYLDSNGNLAQIVKAAGYNMTDKAAAVQATRLLKNAKIQQAIREARERRRKAYTVTASWVLEQIAQIEAAASKEPVPDEDAAVLTEAQAQAAKARRAEQKKQVAAIRISPETPAKAKTIGKGYTGFLS